MDKFNELVEKHYTVKNKATVAKENAEQVVLDIDVQISDHNTRLRRAQTILRKAIIIKEKAIAFIAETDSYEILKEKLDAADAQIIQAEADIAALEYSLKITKERMAIYNK